MADLSAEVAPSLAPLEIEYLPEYVTGFPVHIAATLRSPSWTFRRLPYADFIALNQAFGIMLTKTGAAAPAIVLDPVTVVDPDLGMPVMVLGQGTLRRILADFSSAIPAGLEPGEYEAVLAYGPPQSRTQSRPFRVRFRDPNEAERQALAEIGPEVQSAGSWGLWILSAPQAPTNEQISKDDPARFNRVVRYLLHAPQPREAAIEALDGDGLYAPEAAVLRAEWQAIQNRPERARQEAEAARAKYPGLQWWTDRIPNGSSPIAARRALR